MNNAEIEKQLKALGYDRVSIASYRQQRIPDRVRMELFELTNPQLKDDITEFLISMKGFGKDGK